MFTPKACVRTPQGCMRVLEGGGPKALEVEAAWYPKVPGHGALLAHLVPAGRWGYWPLLPACQLALVTGMGLQPISHRHTAGTEEQMGWPAGPLALCGAASWLCCAWCLGTSGLALVGRITDIPASCGWAAGTSSREESSSVPCWLPRKEEGS